MSDRNVGDVVRVGTFTEVSEGVFEDAPFRDENGVAKDPTEIYISLRRRGEPPVVKTGGQVSRYGTGLYRADFELFRPGSYIARVVGTGAVTAAESVEFEVTRGF